MVWKIVCATSGEGPALSVPERKALTEEWVKAIKSTKLHLMVLIGGAPLPDVLELVCLKLFTDLYPLRSGALNK